MRHLLIGSLLLSLAGSIWGAMFIAVRWSIFVIPPVPLVWMRYGTALLALLAVGYAMHVDWHIARKDWKLLVLSALTGQTLSIVTQEMGTMLTSAQTGSVITAATPAFMVVFGCWLLHEKLTLGRVASVVLATVGVLFIVFDPDNLQITWLGGLSLFVAALTWALMSVLVKFLHHYSVVTVTFYSVLIAFLVLTPYGLWWLFTQADYTAMAAPSIWGSVLYLGFISTTAGFCLWNKGLTYMDASIGGLFMFWQPVVGTFLGWLLLSEPVTKYFWLGFGCIVIGVVLAMRGGNTTAAEKLARQDK
ncbi:MAG: DMT family transporter [Selenomonas sp.]|nr:DMT family transporter [Selenomonas sp.]MDD6119306.1 DMT family transporter [Selenomonadaceae bacterium]MDD7056314.1 DMT family transporter [Selenomonadaceae bacterium]MDY3915353.1 DMT family transporter [Selenomonadaceae bacterium]